MAHITSVRPLVSILVPCYNEAESIEHFYRAITQVMDAQPDVQFEVVFVDDGSQDDTLGRMTAVVSADERFRVLELSRNFGKEAALTAAVDHARGDAIIPIDVDLQDPPEVIHQLIAAWRNGAEVVLARRTNRQSDSVLKRSTATIFYRLHNKLSTVKIPEDVGDFRLLDRVAVDALVRLPERQRFMKGLFAWIGFKTVVINYTRHVRTAGKTKFSGWKLWNLALEGITSFSAAPLKVWTYVGGIGAVGSLAYAAYITLLKLISGIAVPGYPSLLVTMLFLGSVQLIGIGILGEYIGRIYMESKGRPPYIVRKQYGTQSVDVASGTGMTAEVVTPEPPRMAAAARR